MTRIDEYLETLNPPVRSEMERIREVVRRIVPEAEEGKSYGVPAYLYRGKGLLSAIENKKFLSLYPFSGKVVERLKEELAGFECTSGSIHFTLDHPLPEPLIEALLRERIAEIA